MRKSKCAWTKHQWILVVIVLLGLIAGCNKPPKEGIVGKWKHAGDQSITEFFKDGTISASTGADILTGRYTWLDETRIKVEFGGIYGMVGPQIWQVSIDGSELRITFSGIGGKSGGTAIYKRVKD